MNDEASFLKALAERPQDDALRQVYAGWLEERGDPRAGYLRLEVRLANVTPEDSSYRIHDGRLREMRSKFDPSWLLAAGKLYDVVLRSCSIDERDRLIRRVFNYLNVTTRLQARELVESAPCLVQQGVPITWAEDTCAMLRRKRTRRWDLVTDGDVVACAIVSPFHALAKRPVPRSLKSEGDMMDAIQAEAIRLGMTLDEFIRSTNVNNRVLKLADQFVRDRETS